MSDDIVTGQGGPVTITQHIKTNGPPIRLGEGHIFKGDCDRNSGSPCDCRAPRFVGAVEASSRSSSASEVRGGSL